MGTGTRDDAVSTVSRSFYCGACQTWIRTDGASQPTAAQLWTELEEHQAELHD